MSSRAQVVAAIAARHGDVFAALAGTAGLNGEDVDAWELGRRLGGRGETRNECGGVRKAPRDTDGQIMHMLMPRLHWELRFSLNAKTAGRYIKAKARPPGLSPLSRAELQAVGGVSTPLARMAASCAEDDHGGGQGRGGRWQDDHGGDSHVS